MDIAAIQSGSRVRHRTQDFLLEFGDERAKVEVQPATQTWQEQRMIAQMWCASANTPSKRKWKRT